MLYPRGSPAGDAVALAVGHHGISALGDGRGSCARGTFGHSLM